jgi:uncharacterized protein YndB with AHSA1/START domain
MTVLDKTLSLDLTHHFDAAPEAVFDAWLREDWGQWLAPGGVCCTSSIINPRSGGRYSVTMRMPEGREVVISGTYREILRPSRLVFTWQGDYNREETLVTLTFKPKHGGTEMRLVQQGFTTEEFRDRHHSGWTGENGSFAKLAKRLNETSDKARPVLEIIRRFETTPEALFDAWLVRDEWQAWIGPEGCRCDVPLLEARVGGQYRIQMRFPDGREIPVAGTFEAIERPRRFVFTWGWEGDVNRQSRVTISLRDMNGQTELTLRQEGLPTPEDREQNGRGWNSALNKLTRYLKGEPV